MEQDRHCSDCYYDYIIVGAGCAGSVMAARLAEDPNVRVLLLEGGHDNLPVVDNNEINDYQKRLINIPAMLVALLPRYHVNPILMGCGADKANPFDGQIEASPTHLEFTTIKEYKRYYTYPRGNGAGGSTNHHNMIDGRGSHLPYERIAKELNDPKWLYDNILKYYKKMENYHVADADPKYHGKDGWLQVKHTAWENELTRNLIETINKDLNIPFVGDLNIPGQYSGIGYNDAQASPDGTRSFAYKDLLYPMLMKQQHEGKQNLFVKFNSLVCKVLLEGEADNIKAYGVEVLENPHLYKVDTTGNKVIDKDGKCIAVLPEREHGRLKKYYAKKEVILCGGVFNTPQILMLSGLGPRDELEKYGIDTRKHLPGVGQNFMDHHEFCMNFLFDPEKFMWRWQAEYLSQDIHLAPEKIRRVIEKYRDPKALGDNDCHLILDWHSGMEEINMDEPDLHFQFINHMFFDFNLNFIKVDGDDLNDKETNNDNTIPNALLPKNKIGIPGVKDKLFTAQFDASNPMVYMGILIENMKVNKPTGSVTLRSSDPRDPPIIELGLWKDDVVLRRLAKSVMIVRQFMKSPRMMQFAKFPDNYSLFEILPGTAANTEEKIMEYLRTWSSIGHHGSGTARMGRADDEMAVVDSDLCVRGVKGLRIVDASVYPAPNLHAYNPTRGIYMIAEMMSDVIKNQNTISYTNSYIKNRTKKNSNLEPSRYMY